jgi:lysyl-tRNA synthetase class 2
VTDTAERRRIALARARMMEHTRFRLGAKGYLEVETPLMVRAPGMEPQISAFETDFVPEMEGLSRRRLYLHTSPEYAMKRLIADGFGHVFQLCKVFRNGEIAATHNPEFTMLELYRSPGTVDELLSDLEDLLRALARQPWADSQARMLDRPFERLTVRQAFERHATAGMPEASAPDFEDRFFRSFLEEVEPALAKGPPCFLTEYPASMAALARLKSSDPSVSERFELYASGFELANGFGELNDAQEQRGRLVAEQEQRRRRGRPVYSIDERFLDAVGRMPPSAGVAMGMDRVLMLLLGKVRIEDVLLFPASTEWVDPPTKST